MSVMESRRKIWTQARIDSEKRAIKAELDAIESSGGADGRFSHALNRIRELQEDESPLARLRCFIFIVSALVHASRRGGLKRSQVARLVRLAEAILATQGVKSSSSRLSILYGELYLAVSHWHWFSGEHWKSSWEHQISHHLSQRNPPGGEGYQLFSRGLRAMRLGHAELALRLLEEAEAKGLPARSLAPARIQRARALRLARRWDEAERLLARSLQLPLSDAERKELE